jgi:hypothetical protein
MNADTAKLLVADSNGAAPPRAWGIPRGRGVFMVRHIDSGVQQ